MCYYYMFAGATALERVKVHFNEWNSSSNATLGWFQSNKKAGIFECPEGLDTETNRDISHVPAAWTVKTFDPEI